MRLFCKAVDVGRLGERLAAKYLKKQGYRIVARNLHLGRNELDLIVKNKEYIAFVEVKTRSFYSMQQALEHRPSAAVNAGKRARTVQAAREYLKKHKTGLCPRLDVVEVYLSRADRMKPFKIHHIEGAFDAAGRVR